MLQIAEKAFGSQKCALLIALYFQNKACMCMSKQITKKHCIDIRRTETTTAVKQSNKDGGEKQMSQRPSSHLPKIFYCICSLSLQCT